MFVHKRLSLSFLVLLVCTGVASAQQESPPVQNKESRIYLDVVVSAKDGPPVTGLQQQDFTVLDNDVPRSITSFRALTRDQNPLKVILVVDGVNASYQTVAYERGAIDKFLHADGGHLAHPSALAVFSDAGMQVQEGFSDDGNALSAALEQEVVGLRTIRRSAAFYGAVERFQLSLNALRQLAAREAPDPGRKIILWVSPGWPFLSGPEIELDSKQQQEFFDQIVSISTTLLEDRITLYSIDPSGDSDFGTRTFYYMDFVKGVREPRQVQLGDLALQVIAVQSGGLALQLNNDVAFLLQKCLADTDAYYEITFDPPVTTKRDEYHRLEIKLTKSGLTARTRQGYYAQPEVKEPRKVPIEKNSR